jgi:eukaryotic-like serine/threonine-protein kinase
VLAIETARSGNATGEVTSVLRTLPTQAQSRVPFRVRHRMTAALLLAIALAVVVGGVAYVASRSHHGTGRLATPPPQHSLKQVVLCQTCAQGFNPLGSPSDEAPNAGNAIDNQLGTYWDTQQYYDEKLGKAGTGIYVDAAPGTAAQRLQIIDATPGFTATIYARTTRPPLRWPDPGWVQISSPTVVTSKTTIKLTSGQTRYSYFLVWITSLGGHEQLAIDEVTLYYFVARG